MKYLLLAAALLGMTSAVYQRAARDYTPVPAPYTTPASTTEDDEEDEQDIPAADKIPYQRGIRDYNTGHCFHYGPFFDDEAKTKLWRRGYDDATALDAGKSGAHCSQ